MGSPSSIHFPSSRNPCVLTGVTNTWDMVFDLCLERV
jgi:hypothetical protein